MPLLATTPSPFAPELNGRPVEAEGPGKASAAESTDSEPQPVGLDVAGLAERIVPFPVEAGRYDKLRAAKDGVVWLELPRAGELGEAVIGAAEEHPKARLVRYDLAKRKRIGRGRGTGRLRGLRRRSPAGVPQGGVARDQADRLEA